MSADPQLFRINPDNHESEAITEVDFAQLGFQERRDIQEWVAANPGILGEDLLIIGKEFSGFDRTNERLDLLAADEDGRLVVIELKRDDTGADAHWQAIKYASYLHRVDADRIIEMLAGYVDVSKADAANKLLQHLNADDLNALNNDQRIILASHRFAPEVTSAALWLNEKVPGESLITCIQLTPYRDVHTGSLYVQANTIIPVPGIDDYVVGVGDPSGSGRDVVRGSSALAQTFARNRNDEITRFLREVAELAVKELPGDVKPDRTSKWAGNGGWAGSGRRHYHLWYRHQPWGNWDMSYFVNLYDKEEASNTWRAEVGLLYWNSSIEHLENRLVTLQVYDDQQVADKELRVSRQGTALDDAFANALAETMSCFIETTKRQIEALADEGNEEGT